MSGLLTLISSGSFLLSAGKVHLQKPKYWVLGDRHSGGSGQWESGNVVWVRNSCCQGTGRLFPPVGLRPTL